MKKTLLTLVLIVVLSTFTQRAKAMEKNHIFLVTQAKDEVTIEKVEVKQNEFKVIQQENLITYIPVF